MTKLTRIEKALLELSQGSFQKLADAYLYKKGYTQINPLGSVIGSNKTRKGTPDTYITLPNGKYVFAEYTTQQSGVCEKFKKDLKKCFDETKNGVPVEMIEEVVLCYTSTLSLDEKNVLAMECQKHGVNLNDFGIGRISFDLCYDYRRLARDFLAVEIDTGQILPPNEFVAAYNTSKVVAPLNTGFHFRDEKVDEVLQKLETGKLVIVSGRPGVGKSRLALECCKRFSETHDEYRVYCVLNLDQDLFQDIRDYFSEPGNFLILVDDANRISRFEYIVQLIQLQRDDQHFKVVATVRDYALEKVMKATSPLGLEKPVELQVMEDAQIKKLVRDEYDILNPDYLDRIAKVARGNPRLAIMAAEVASRENTLEGIHDVSALYDEYFASIRKDIDDFDDSDVLKAAGIVAFFRSVDRTNEAMMSSIEEAFGISTETFWDAARKLHNLEIVDIYEDEVVRTSDQVLSTYLFYLAFFKEQVLDFSAILNHFFPSLKHRLVDAVSPVMIAFDIDAIKEAMRPHVDEIWKSMEERGDHENLLHLMDDFWFINPTKTLLYVKNRIQEMEAKPTDISKIEFKANSALSSPSLLSVLGSFEQAEDKATFRMVLDLLFGYLDKRPEEVAYVLYLLTDKFGFKDKSYLRVYMIQREAIDVLWDRTQRGIDELYSKLFISVAENCLHVRFHTTEWEGHRTYRFFDFQLVPTPELFELRRAIWRGLFQLYKTSTLSEGVLDLLLSYSTLAYTDSVNEIMAQDSLEILPFIESELDPTSYRHCFLVHRYLDSLDHYEVPFDPNLRNRFTNGAYDLSKILFSDWSEMEGLDPGFDEYEQFKKEQMEEYFRSFSFDEYVQFFKTCSEILDDIDSGDEFRLQSSVEDVMLELSERDPDLYVEVLKYYIDLGDPFHLDSMPLVKSLVNICGVERACEILTLPDYPTKRVWLIDYYLTLPESEVTNERLSRLYDLHKEAQLTEFRRNYDLLLKYRSIDKDVVAKITEITLKKSEDNCGFVNPLKMMFNRHGSVPNVM